MNLEFQNIGHHYGSAPALTNVDLLVPSGEITCLLGSSGCGKTTLLNLAAGLLDIQQGSIALDGDVLADPVRNPPPEKRPIGLVFQDGALFPHMSIADNILFGVDKVKRSAALAEQWLEMIGLAGLAERFPSSLSGGQAQRVALARAMAPEPAVLLLDEPFASIDVVLRRDLRRECRRLLKARNATAIMVTHDPEEAMDVADQIAVMDGGHIVQTGAPDALYNQPATLGVGTMFGDSQVVSAQVEGDAVETAFGTWPLAALTEEPQANQLNLLIRDGALTAKTAPDGFAVTDIRKTGRSTRLTLANEAGDEINVSCNTGQVTNASERFSLHPKPASIIAFAKEA